MDEERWNDAKSLFAAALERDPAQRDAFLRDACGQNESLRVEVESLLSAYRTSDGLSTPAWIEQPEIGANVEGRTQQGKQDESIGVLADAVSHGLKAEKISAIQTDPNFKSLRGSAGFKALVADTKRR